MLHNALHLHEARTFYQYRRRRGCSLVNCGAHGVDGVEMTGRDRGSRHGVVFIDGVAETEKMVNTAFACISADFPMEFWTFVTNLTHVAQGQHAWRSGLREHVDGGAHGVRIGVVGVVDDQCTTDRRLALQATIDRRESFQTAYDRGG